MVVVFSLGGSIIIPGEVDVNYLKKFVLLVKRLSKKEKIVVVTGGGITARKYINSLNGHNVNTKSHVGIISTKLNAALVLGFFNRVERLPDSLKEVKKSLRRNNIIVCGSLGFQPNMTSDGDAAEIARYLKARLFINLTDVNGLYDKNPKLKNAKLIPRIGFYGFLRKANKFKYKPGQHFVLDQCAAEIIVKSKIKTCIINGRRFKDIENCFLGKKFLGTVIYG